ncbi:hypothetical protein T484DRAFT_1855682 [Baffinella frigidus]|nr:hypothetical protein T484DRAFT_1855682 [Cryptophyta sp. CCMP2293]
MPGLCKAALLLLALPVAAGFTAPFAHTRPLGLRTASAAAAPPAPMEARKVPLGVIDEAKMLAGQDFPFTEQELIQMTYDWIETKNGLEQPVGLEQPDMLADSFNFRSPTP